MRPALLILASIACNPPLDEAGIDLGPMDPTTLDDLVVTLDDAPGEGVTYRYAWFRDGQRVLGLSGKTVPASWTTKGETWTVEVTPTDGTVDGDTVDAEVTILNSPPVVTLALSPEAPPTSADLVADVVVADADGDPVTLETTWTVDGEPVEVDGNVVRSHRTARDETWAITVTPTDDEGAGDAVSAEVDITNTTPIIRAVGLRPDPPTRAEPIRAVLAVVDADADELEIRYIWTVNDANAQEGTSDRLAATRFDKHDTVYVTAFVQDDELHAEPVTSDVVEVANDVPAIEAVALTPTDAVEGSTLTCLAEGRTDADDDPENDTRAWFVNGTELAESGETLDGAAFDRGDTVSCRITPEDDEDTGEAVDSEPVVIGNSAPSIASVTLSPAEPTESDAVAPVVTGASDDDGDAISHLYSWSVNGVAVSNDPTLTGALFDKGDTIRVEVTPADDADEGATVTSDTVTAVNAPPVVSAVALSPSAIGTDTLVSVDITDSDADDDTITYTYAWFVDGTQVAETGPTLAGTTWFDVGQTLSVTVTPNDGDEDGAPASSATVTVQNEAPTAPVVSVAPTDPLDGDDLLCAIDTPSTDADGDSISYTFSWTVDGVAFSGATTTTWTGDTVLAADTGIEEVWVCSVTASDGSATGEPGTAMVGIELPSCDGADCPFYGDIDLGSADVRFLGVRAHDDAGAEAYNGGDIDGDGDDDIVIGAHLNDDGGSDAGAIYVITADPSGWMSLSAADARLYGDSSGDYVGRRAGPAGDLDNDGYDDLAIGGHGDTAGGTAAGAVWLVHGPVTTSGALGSAETKLTGSLGERVGFGLAGDGDIDGDGVVDLVIGANHRNDAGTSSGGIYLVSGPVTADASLSSIGVTWDGEAASHVAGYAVAIAGDTDGDGLDDVLVGAPGSDAGGNTSGAAYLLHGPATGGGSLSRADTRFIGEGVGDRAGSTVEAAGDVDADGYDDVIVVAPTASRGGTDAGAIYLFHGPVSTGNVDLSSFDAVVVGESNSDQAGRAVASMGDLDGDLHDDLVIGAYQDDDGGTNAGAAYVVLGPVTGTVDLGDAQAKFIGETSYDAAGFAVGAGDFDGDGITDVLVGADEAGSSAQGAAYLIYGDW